MIPTQAKKLLVTILTTGGRVEFPEYVLGRMKERGISQDNVIATLKGGVVEPAEMEDGSYRYRVRRGKHYAVVAFRTETWTVVVTTWRKK